jgi:hypothetical protein
MNRAEHGSEYCRVCGGRSTEEREELRGYLLAKAQDRSRLAAIADELEPVKELRESIALLHMLIERRFNLIKNDAELLAACGPLNQMLQNMERLVSSCHKIEQNLGLLLAKHAVLGLAQAMVQIIVDELEGIDDYEAIVDRITARLIAMVQGSNNQVIQSSPLLALPSLTHEPS